MQEAIGKIRLPLGMRDIVILMLALLCISFAGCATKKTVIYVPREISHFTPNESINDREIVGALREYFHRWQGTRYSYGGLSHDGVDCSGLTLLTYRDVFGKNLPRTVKGQLNTGRKVEKDSLQAGDLVFFKTGLLQTHVGIYLEDDLFFHASGSKGVIISNLNNEYWQTRYYQAHRL